MKGAGPGAGLRCAVRVSLYTDGCVRRERSSFISRKWKFFEKQLKGLSTKTLVKEFPSRKERLAYFASVLGDCDLNQIIDRIIEINSLDNLVPIEKDKLKKLIKILEEETSAIYKISSAKSKEFISDFLVKE